MPPEKASGARFVCGKNAAFPPDSNGNTFSAVFTKKIDRKYHEFDKMKFLRRGWARVHKSNTDHEVQFGFSSAICKGV